VVGVGQHLLESQARLVEPSRHLELISAAYNLDRQLG
jgi:hypothetical protein